MECILTLLRYLGRGESSRGPDPEQATYWSSLQVSDIEMCTYVYTCVLTCLSDMPNAYVYELYYRYEYENVYIRELFIIYRMWYWNAHDEYMNLLYVKSMPMKVLWDCNKWAIIIIKERLLTDILDTKIQWSINVTEGLVYGPSSHITVVWSLFQSQYPLSVKWSTFGSYPQWFGNAPY